MSKLPSILFLAFMIPIVLFFRFVLSCFYFITVFLEVLLLFFSCIRSLRLSSSFYLLSNLSSACFCVFSAPFFSSFFCFPSSSALLSSLLPHCSSYALSFLSYVPYCSYTFSRSYSIRDAAFLFSALFHFAFLSSHVSRVILVCFSFFCLFLLMFHISPSYHSFFCYFLFLSLFCFSVSFPFSYVVSFIPLFLCRFFWTSCFRPRSFIPFHFPLFLTYFLYIHLSIYV
jgi:hypothetical protein